MGRFDGKVVLVTGGASGMGAATAKLIATEGAHVAICDLDENGGAKRVDEIKSAGGSAIFQKLDVTKEAQWEAVVAAVVSAFGSLHVLVNNAGISGSGYQDQGDVQAWDDLMAINATGPFLGTKHAAPEIIKAGGGAIVNISSIKFQTPS